LVSIATVVGGPSLPPFVWISIILEADRISQRTPREIRNGGPPCVKDIRVQFGDEKRVKSTAKRGLEKDRSATSLRDQ
jgi:hypothetical protein